MKCASCGYAAPEGASFCPECGTRLVIEPVTPAPEAAAEAAVEPAPEPATEPAVKVAPAPMTAPEPEPQPQPATAPEPELAPEAEVEPAVEVEPASRPATASESEPATAPAAAPVNPYAQATAPAAQPTDGAAASNPYAQSAQATSSANAWTASQQASNPYVQSQPSYGQPQGAPAGAPVGAAFGQVYYSEGCISAALADIRGSQNWFGSALVLGLINCVPILNFVSQGYLLNWSREVPFGGKTQMPKKYFSGKNFEIGFYFFLISLVFALVVGVASALFVWIPLIGWLAVLAFSFGVSMFTQLCGMRMAMMQQLGDGFAIGKAWQMVKRNWTGLLCAAVVPSLVAGLVIGAIALVASLLGMGAIAPMALIDPYSFGGGAAAGMLGALGLLGVLVMLVVMVICLVIEFFASLVTVRAVAHWVGRYAPEWASEATYRASSYGAPLS